jgi:hypothetical protein
MPRPNALYESWHPSPGCRHKPGQTYTRYPCSCGREVWPPRGRGRGESLYSPRRIEAKLRAVEAFKLRCQGWRFKQIAAHLGYGSAKSAWRAWRRTLDEVTAQRNYEERRRAEGGRPHYPRPTQWEVDQVMASYAADERMANERVDAVQEQMLVLLAEAKRRVRSEGAGVVSA